MQRLLHLENVVEIETLQKIQDDFSEATGFAAITVDFRGKAMTKHSGSSKYCKIVRHRAGTKELCEKCDARAGLEASRVGKPYIYMCHSGFVDFAAPIIIEDQYLGSIMGGQVISSEKTHTIKKIIRETVDIEDDVELIEAYMQIPIVPLSKIEAAANMIYTITNKVVEKGYLNFIQDQFHHQSLQLIKAKEAEAKLESALRAAELKILQSQINRQFLIQTLNTIANLSFIEKAQKTEDATYILIEVVKYLIANINKDVEIQEEVVYLKNYLSLQKIRLGSRLSYEIIFSEKVKHMLIPSVMIQPIVENAIVHGLETKSGKCSVKIKISLVEDAINIVISDNGVGMETKLLDKILTKNSDYHHSTTMNLQILQQRLTEKYEEKASLHISSEVDKGTIVTIIIPASTSC